MHKGERMVRVRGQGRGRRECMIALPDARLYILKLDFPQGPLHLH